MKESDNRMKAWFLGPKAENADLVEKLIVDVFRDHVFWRRNFHPEDKRHISESDKRQPDYEDSMTQLQQALGDLLARLKNDIPFFSPRYIGHMLADQVLPGIVGYFAAMLYNPNNVTREASPVTTSYEVEVAQQLARMVGYETEKSWGHVTSGGTVANFEALWVARNLKYFPLAVKDAHLAARQRGLLGPEDDLEILLPDGTRVKDFSQRTEWELINLTPQEALRTGERFRALMKKRTEKAAPPNPAGSHWKSHLISEQGIQQFFLHHPNLKPGVVLVPQSRHYSLDKVADGLGLGQGSLLPVPLNHRFRMDVNELRGKLHRLADEQVPVIAVVSVCGSTEEGAIDELDKIVEIRRELERSRNFTFFLHSDAAYGGYFTSLLTAGGKKLSEKDFIAQTGLSAEVYRGLSAMRETDSITIDPHKLGFVPYPAGGILFRDRTFRELTAFRAPYIFHEGSEDDFIGGHILEGSKPGASAAACYLAHKVIPLDSSGYGALLRGILKGAAKVYEFVQSFRVPGYKIQPLAEPDTNIVCFVVNREGNRSLKTMNELNWKIYRRFSFHEKPRHPVSAHDFFLSMTEFNYELYDSEVIRDLLAAVGIPADSFGETSRENPDRCDRLVVLRMTAMNPFLRESDYVRQFALGLKEFLTSSFKAGFSDAPPSGW